MSSEPLYSHLNSRGQLPSAMQVRTRRFLSRWTWVWGGSILKYGGTSSTGGEGGGGRDRKKDVTPGWKRADAQQPNSPEMRIPNQLLPPFGFFILFYFFNFPALIGELKVNREACQKAPSRDKLFLQRRLTLIPFGRRIWTGGGVIGAAEEA